MMTSSTTSRTPLLAHSCPAPPEAVPLPAVPSRTAVTPATRYIGLDVHAEDIAVAVAEPDGQVHALGVIQNTPVAVAALVKKLAVHGHPLAVCYETGPTGYVLYRQLTALGVHCDVVAVGLIPTKPTDRVKTDRRDALKLARLYRSGDLTPVWVPDAAHEAVRDLVRARKDAVADRHRARLRVNTLLLRRGLRRPQTFTAWSTRHRQWLQHCLTHEPCFADLTATTALRETFLDYLGEVDRLSERVTRLERAIRAAVDAAPRHTQTLVRELQAVRGIAFVGAVTVVAELGTFTCFAKATQLMSYAGLTVSEHSSGGTRRQGASTKGGNAHLRRLLVEAAWAYRFAPRANATLTRRAAPASEASRAIAWTAQRRLCQRYRALAAEGKLPTVAVTAVARELLGFLWAIGRTAEAQAEAPLALATS